MAGKLREIRKRIRSVQSTQKITKSFELIAASRIVRAERRVREARPFSDRLAQVIRDLAATAGQVDHPILQRANREKTERPAALIVVAADRGLAGAYNANVLRLFERTRREMGDVVTYAVGKKALAAFRFRKIPMEAEWSGFSDAPTFDRAREIGERIVADFAEGKIGSVRVVYTEFVSLMTQRATIVDLLPVATEELEGGHELSATFEFEPSPEGILDELLPMYVEVRILQALLEAAASEHAARRRAMSSATENAEELIKNLTRVANQARQSEITSEIADIVGGSEALRKMMTSTG
ncbi:MAG: F0F1 ATP synthase subunit gamma [Actinomycetota bacterium]